MPDGKKKTLYENWLNTIESDFDVIQYDKFAADIYGELYAKAEKAGKRTQMPDTQIAATALANGMVLVTRNVQDYQPLTEFSMLHLENWFSE